MVRDKQNTGRSQKNFILPGSVLFVVFIEARCGLNAYRDLGYACGNIVLNEMRYSSGSDGLVTKP